MGVKVREKVKGSGQWWCFLNHQGQRRSELIGSKAAAVATAAKWQVRLHEGDASVFSKPVMAKPTASPTFEVLAEEWMPSYWARFKSDPSTQANHRSFLTQRAYKFLGYKPVDQIDRVVLGEFIAWLRTEGLKDSTITANLPTVGMVLAYAVDRKLIPSNPMRGGSPLWKAEPSEKEPKPFSPDEVKAVLGAADQVNKGFGPLLRFGLCLGARHGEVRALNVGDLLPDGRVSIHRTYSQGALKERTKNRKSRVVSLLPIAGLDPDQVLREVRALAKGRPVAAPLFLSPHGERVTEGSLKERWNRVIDLSGVERREPEQWFRHTLACYEATNTGNPFLIAAQLGDTVGIVTKHYAKAFEAARTQPHPTAPSAHSRLRRVK